MREGGVQNNPPNKTNEGHYHIHLPYPARRYSGMKLSKKKKR